MIDFNASWLKIIIIVVLCVLGWLKRHNLSLKVIRAVSNIPGNSVWYLFMNFYIFWGSPEFIWIRFREMNRKYLSIFKIWGGNRVLIFLKHPDEVEVNYFMHLLNLRLCLEKAFQQPNLDEQYLKFI